MPGASHKFSRRPLPAFTVLAGLLIGFVPGCAKPATTEQAEPEVAPQEEPGSAMAGTQKEVQARPNEPIEAILRGRTSGVSVSLSPTGVLSVRIRGATSFYGSAEPLYVVDGTPVRPGPGGALVGINPYEIESIKVLKGPPETTVYGVRGANGVVVIKMKNSG